MAAFSSHARIILAPVISSCYVQSAVDTVNQEVYPAILFMDLRAGARGYRVTYLRSIYGQRLAQFKREESDEDRDYLMR